MFHPMISMASTLSCWRLPVETGVTGVTKTAGKPFVQREGGARLCYVNIGRERRTKKGELRKMTCQFLDGQDSQKDSISHFFNRFFFWCTYFVFYFYLCTARSALDYNVVLIVSINIAFETRQVCFKKENFIRNGNKDLTTRRTIQMRFSILFNDLENHLKSRSVLWTN